MPRLSLKTVLIGINLVVLLLPLAGIQLMRLYESALVRQTESALIAQAAFIGAFYRTLFTEQGLELPPHDPSLELSRWQDGQWSPRSPTLDLVASPVGQPFPEGVVGGTAESYADVVGQRLISVLKDAQLVTLAGIRVVDRKGIIVASTGDDVGLSIASGREIQSALAGIATSNIRHKSDVVVESALDSISRNSRVRVFVASPIVLQDRLLGAIMLSRTPPNIVQALYAKRWLLLQAFLFLVAIVLVMSAVTHRLIARPIARLADQASNITRGVSSGKDLASEKPHIVEVARLQQAIVEMAAALEARATHLQDFSRHVSHEFKTPITGIQGAIEVLTDHPDMDDTQRSRFLSNISGDADRMKRLTERLLELTQAEIRTHKLEGLDLHSVVVDVQARWPMLHFNLTDVTSTVVASREVVEATLATLADNAAQHGATHIRMWSRGNDCFVEDDGHGISAANAARLFEPFFTTQRESGGTGLGLTIARSLMRGIRGDLLLVSKAGDPTTFRLSFPS
jgi:signal transduction histidine kinase